MRIPLAATTVTVAALATAAGLAVTPAAGAAAAAGTAGAAADAGPSARAAASPAGGPAVIPSGGAVLYGVGLGDGGSVLQAGVDRAGGATYTRRAPFAFETVLGANAGLVLVVRSPATAGTPTWTTVVRTVGGQTLRTALGVPDSCAREDRCWPLPDGLQAIRRSADGVVTSIDLTTGQERGLATLTSSWPDAEDASFGGAMSAGSRYLYANDDGVLVRIDTSTGAKEAVFDDPDLEMVPVCTTSSGAVLAWRGWYEGDPSMPSFAWARIDPATGRWTRLALSWKTAPMESIDGCTANGRWLIGMNQRDNGKPTSWATVRVTTGKRGPLPPNPYRFAQLSGPYVDNGVGR